MARRCVLRTGVGRRFSHQSRADAALSPADVALSLADVSLCDSRDPVGQVQVVEWSPAEVVNLDCFRCVPEDLSA